jgi:hypothetical protein
MRGLSYSPQVSASSQGRTKLRKGCLRRLLPVAEVPQRSSPKQVLQKKKHTKASKLLPIKSTKPLKVKTKKLLPNPKLKKRTPLKQSNKIKESLHLEALTPRKLPHLRKNRLLFYGQNRGKPQMFRNWNPNRDQVH